MIRQIARQALSARMLVRLPFEGGAFSRLRTVAAAANQRPQPGRRVVEIVDRLWREHGDGRFDGRLLGVAEAFLEAESATLACEAIAYRDYLATDALLAEPDAAPVALAIGVHAVLSNGERLLCLRRDDGRPALPGGAVDYLDFEAAPEAAVEHALAREIAEETGLILPPTAFEVTGLYVGGYPTHLLVLATAALGDVDLEAAGEVARAQHDEAIAGVDLLAFEALDARMPALPLVLRAGLQSLAHRRGRGSFETIAI